MTCQTRRSRTGCEPKDDTFWTYRLLACFGCGVAVILTLALPYRMHRPDPWACYYAVQNFARGEFVVSDDRHAYQSLEAKALGGHLDQYVRLGEDRWALEKAPGFPLFVVPFYWLGFPRAANVVLSLAATGAIYLFLRQLLDEGAACLGALLLLFSPANLVALHQSYMDTFASGALPAIGGGLYFYYMLRRDGPSQASPNTWSQGFSRGEGSTPDDRAHTKLGGEGPPALRPALKHRTERAKPPSGAGFQPEGLRSFSATASASRSRRPKPASPPTDRCAQAILCGLLGPGPRPSPLLLFPAGLFLSWAVVSRPINLYLALLLALHLSLTSLTRLVRDRAIAFDFEPLSDRHSEERNRACPEQSRREGSRPPSNKNEILRSLRSLRMTDLTRHISNTAGLFRDPALAWRELVSFGLGCGLSLAVLLAYNNHVFGAPLDYGYEYSPYKVRFVYGQLLYGDPAEQEEARQAIVTSLRGLPQPLCIGFPLLGAALPGLIYARRRLPFYLYCLSVGWLLAVFVPYVGFIWIARLVLLPINTTWRFFVIARYFVPWLFPLVVLAVVWLHSALKRWGLALAVVYGLAGAWLYLRALAVG